MRSVFFTLSVLALVSAPALADDPGQPKEERKICRRMEAPTGSNRPGKRICHTEAEWKALDSGVADYAQPDQRSPGSTKSDGQ
ncbi:MAG: hypothetical protein ACKOOL_09695 [Novosphingobium sp.]